MPSPVWSRTTDDAYSDPYEYAAEEQFRREAVAVLQRIRIFLGTKNLTFEASEQSLQKAQWMLANDAVVNSLDCLDALEKCKHRIASKLFRCIVEGIDRLRFFSSGTAEGSAALAMWYRDKEVPHRDIRRWIETSGGVDAKNSRKRTYGELSQFLHGAYRALLDGYTRGRGDRMVYDGSSDTTLLVPRQTLSVYYVHLASLIEQLGIVLIITNTVEHSVVASAWEDGLEQQSAPRHFAERGRMSPPPA